MEFASHWDFCLSTPVKETEEIREEWRSRVYSRHIIGIGPVYSQSLTFYSSSPRRTTEDSK